MYAQNEKVTPVNISEQMQQAYIDYSMSVIVGRALPDARDGLKPSNRRVLYAMRQIGLLHNRSYSKCAKVVGEVLGKYHPHGDASVYDTLVRMAQDFAMRYPLIDGQGNFGSIDGDPAAAYRYTECRLKEIAEELLADLDKDTVNFQPNFDEKEVEPVVLPASGQVDLRVAIEGERVRFAFALAPNRFWTGLDADCDATILSDEYAGEKNAPAEREGSPAFTGAFLGLLYWRHKFKASTLVYADLVASSFPVGWVFGRSGCSLAHDHPGMLSNAWFAVQYPGGARFDLGLYEMLLTVPLAVTFLFLMKRPRPPGFFLGIMCTAYAPTRFALDFLRVHEAEYGKNADPRYGGLTPAQWGCLVLLGAGITFLYRAGRAAETDRTWLARVAPRFAPPPPPAQS